MQIYNHSSLYSAKCRSKAFKIQKLHKIRKFHKKIDISERLKLIEAGKRLHNQATESRENVAEYDDIAKDSEISDTDSYDTVYNEGPYRFEVKIAPSLQHFCTFIKKQYFDSIKASWL